MADYNKHVSNADRAAQIWSNLPSAAKSKDEAKARKQQEYEKSRFYKQSLTEGLLRDNDKQKGKYK